MASSEWPSSGGSSSGSNASVGTNGSPIPTSSTLVAGEDPSLNQHPLQTDASGNLLVSASALPLPTGAATAAKQDTGNTSLASIDTKTPALASGRVPVDGSGVTQPVSAASLPLPTGAATETTLAAASAKLPATLGQKAMAASLAVVLASDQSSIPVTVAAGSAVIGHVITDTGSTTAVTALPAIPTGANTIGAVTQSGTWTVQPGNTANTTAWLVSEEKAATSTLSNVSGSATSVSLLASTAGRKGATFYNDSTAILYLKFGTTASTTSYTVQLPSGGYYELPFVRVYTGAIDGIWSAANGAVRITELS